MYEVDIDQLKRVAAEMYIKRGILIDYDDLQRYVYINAETHDLLISSYDNNLYGCLCTEAMKEGYESPFWILIEKDFIKNRLKDELKERIRNMSLEEKTDMLIDDYIKRQIKGE